MKHFMITKDEFHTVITEIEIYRKNHCTLNPELKQKYLLMLNKMHWLIDAILSKQ